MKMQHRRMGEIEKRNSKSKPIVKYPSRSGETSEEEETNEIWQK